MAITSTNYVNFAYVEETTPGVTPATPSFQQLPVTSVGLTEQLDTAVSEVIRSDRQTDDLVVVGAKVEGDCNYELSYAPFKPLILSLMQNTSIAVNIAGAADIDASATTSAFTSATTDFIAAGILVGHYIKVSGFIGTANNGIFRVTAVTANQIDVTPSPNSDELNPGSVSIVGENIRNGANEPDSYTFRKQLNAPGGTTSIFYYRGCQVNSMSFNLASGSILNGTMNLIGLTSEGTATAITGETITAPPAYDIMNAVSSVTNISVTGLPGNVEFKSLNLTIDNQINAADAIGTLGAVDLAPFSLDIKGDLEIYFEDTSVYNIYKNSSGFSVSFTLTDNSGNTMVIYLPYCKFESLTEPVDGKDNFLMESGSLKALRDPVTNMMAQITFM